jgi:hypothetical protein
MESEEYMNRKQHEAETETEVSILIIIIAVALDGIGGKETYTFLFDCSSSSASGADTSFLWTTRSTAHAITISTMTIVIGSRRRFLEWRPPGRCSRS